MRTGTPSWSLRLAVICVAAATVRSWEFDESPQNKTVQVGQKTLIECKAPFNINPNYSYEKDPGNLPNRAKYDSDGLLITNIQLVDEGWYTCTVMSDEDTKSASAYLRVLNAISFSKRPHNITADYDHSASLTCATTISNSVTYRWLKDGKPISSSDKVVIEGGTLTIYRVQVEDVAMYTCKAETKSGTISADAAVLLPDLTPPEFVEIPSNISRQETGPFQITVHCAALGKPAPHMYWEYNGGMISGTTSKYLVQEHGNLYINQVSVQESGRYTCFASNIMGTKSHTTEITVAVPSTRATSTNEILGDTTLFIATMAAAALLVLLLIVGVITYIKCGRHRTYRSRSSYNSRRSSRRRHRRRQKDNVAWDTSGSPSYMMAFPDDSYSGPMMPISEYDYNSRPVSFNFAKRGTVTTSFSHSRRSFSPSDYSYPGFAQPVRNPTFGLDDVQSTLERQMRELDAMASSSQSTPRSNTSRSNASSSHRSETPQKKRQPPRVTSTPMTDRQRTEALRYSTVSRMMSGEPFEEPEEWGPEHEEVVSIQANIRMSRLWEVDSTLRAMKLADLSYDDFDEEEDH
jgi:hypothetical protein